MVTDRRCGDDPGSCVTPEFLSEQPRIAAPAPSEGPSGVLSTRRYAAPSYNGAEDGGCQIEGVKDVKGGTSGRGKKGKIERDGRENARKPT